MEKSNYNKPFQPYQAQIALLKSRGMQFANENKAMHLLENISYYRFSGYWYPLLADKENHVFKPNADFETAYGLYKFDRELRKLIISELEKIEIAVRAKMAYIQTRFRPLSLHWKLPRLVYMLNTVNPDHTFKQKLSNLFLKYSNVDSRAMGFPAQWQTEPLWQ
jgi:abortive infection bacteriophage resistance protein